MISGDRVLGDIQGTREYVNTPWVNDSFPFLWPLLLAPGVALLGPTAPVGGYLFIPIWLLTVLVIAGTTRALRLPGPIAPTFGLALLALPGYVNEGQSGRSIPLTVLLLSCAVWILLVLQSRPRTLLVLLLGLVLGLTAANRFDAVTYGPIFVAIATVVRALTARQALLALGAWAVFPALWSVYSLTRLGGLYVTDNSWVLLSPDPVFVSDWLPPDSGGAGPSLATAEKMINNMPSALDTFALAYWPWAVLAGGSLLGGALLAAILRSSTVERLAHWLSDTGLSGSVPPMLRFLLLATAALTAWHLFLIMGTGYFAPRYWGPVGLLALEVLIFCLAGLAAINAASPGRFMTAAPLMSISLLAIALAALGLQSAVQSFGRQPLDQSRDDASLIACISDLGGVPMLNGGVLRRIPATTDLRTASPPRNAAELTTRDWQDLSAEYGITHWVERPGSGESPAPPAVAGALIMASCPVER